MLFFIALIPPVEIREEIQELKYQFRDEFNSSHSLNAPPHITLISPFRLSQGEKTPLVDLLREKISGFQPVMVRMKDFSTFPPKVIFIDVELTPELKEIQESLEEVARANDDIFNYNYHPRPWHPHITLAFKDLTKKNFYKAWGKFRQKSFKEKFEANKIYLLKHNGENWLVDREFEFNSDQTTQ